MKNPMTFFAAMQSQLKSLEKFKYPANKFTKEDYRKVAKLYTAAGDIPSNFPEDLKANIEQSKALLLESVAQIIDLQFSEADSKMIEANRIMETLKVYLQDRADPDYQYVQTLVKQAGEKGAEALSIVSKKQDFKQELMNVAAEVSSQQIKSFEKKFFQEMDEDDILESSNYCRP